MKPLAMQASLAFLLALLLFLAPHLSAEVISKSASIAGATVEYRVVLPPGYDSSKTYPGILAMPPADQSVRFVDEVLRLNWQEQAEKRGYILVIPAAPGGELFFEGGERIFPAFIEMVLRDYKIQGGKLHIAGMSNGGISAFYIASLYPQYFLYHWVSRLPARRYGAKGPRHFKNVHSHVCGRPRRRLARGDETAVRAVPRSGLARQFRRRGRAAP